MARIALFVASALMLVLYAAVGGETWLEWALRFSSSRALPDGTLVAIADVPRFLLGLGLLALLGGAFWPSLIRLTCWALDFIRQAPSERFLRAALFTAVLIRLVYVLAIDNKPVADWEAYDQLARSLNQGAGYVEGGTLTAYRPPGYPFFLAFLYMFFGPHYLVGELANVILSGGTCWMIYLLGKEFFSEPIGRIAVLVTAVFPTQIYFTGLLASETLFTFFFLLALWLFGKWVPGDRKGANWALLMVGLTLGLASLVRPVTLLYPGVLALYCAVELMLRRLSVIQVARALSFVTIGMVLAFSPWIARNYVVFHEFIPVSTSGAEDFWIGAHPGADGGGQSVSRYEDVVARHGGNHSAGYVEGLQFIREHPGEFLDIGFKKTRRLLLNGNYGVGWEIGTELSKPIPESLKIVFGRIGHVYYLSVLGLALASVLFARHAPPRIHLFYWTFGYWVVFHFFFFGQPRFHLPLEPIFALLASVSLLAILARVPRSGLKEERAQPIA